ncbi:MAG: nucleotidyltransferase domain-containing protein [Thermoplasmata archaeon]|jgi:hypothetical protein|nr:nucleotidyltransferase domain-containing protein [Thermoplasmata archaeon]
MATNSVSTEKMTIEDLGKVIAPIAAKYNITKVYLFGSRARGDCTSDSDYDFIIEVTPEYRWDDHMGFIDSVSKVLNSNVDVITRRSLTDDNFSKDALREMIYVC